MIYIPEELLEYRKELTQDLRIVGVEGASGVIDPYIGDVCYLVADTIAGTGKIVLKDVEKEIPFHLLGVSTEGFVLTARSNEFEVALELEDQRTEKEKIVAMLKEKRSGKAKT